MNLNSPPLTRYAKPAPLLVLLCTFWILFLSGLTQAYYAHLAATQRLALLSAPEWILYRAGPFLFDPLLLFGVLYYVRSRYVSTCSLTELLPGLSIAVIGGNLLGQFVGVRLWSMGNIPLFALSNPIFYRLHHHALHFWLVLATPLIYDFFVVVAAIAVAEVRELKA